MWSIAVFVHKGHSLVVVPTSFRFSSGSLSFACF